MIRRSVPIFLFLFALAFLKFVFDNGRMPESGNMVRAVLFAAIAAPLMRFYWDKRREQREKIIAKAREGTQPK